MTRFRELLSILEERKLPSVPSISSRQSDFLIVGKAIGLLSVPNHSEIGWRSSSTVVPTRESQWKLEPPFDPLVTTWLDQHPDEFSGSKLALANFGLIENDRTRVELVFRQTTWSQVRAFQEAIELGNHRSLTDPLMKYHFDFSHCPVPNIAVVHAIVETNDNKILATQRSEHVQYHPLTWSFSLEEGLKLDDFSRGDDPIKVATARGIAEEVSGESPIRLEEFAILAIALEYPILNPAIITFAKIDRHSSSISSYWTELNRNQEKPEVKAIQFIPFAKAEVSKLLIGSQTNVAENSQTITNVHPTSFYRLLLAMLHRFGLEETVEALKQV